MNVTSPKTVSLPCKSTVIALEIAHGCLSVICNLCAPMCIFSMYNLCTSLGAIFMGSYETPNKQFLKIIRKVTQQSLCLSSQMFVLLILSCCLVKKFKANSFVLGPSEIGVSSVLRLVHK